MNIVECRNLRKEFRDGEDNILVVLEDVTFTVAPGEFVSIRGESGAGKSTLLSVIGTLDHASAGTLRVCGQDIPSDIRVSRLSAFRRENIGFVFQNHYLLPDFSLIDNVMLPLILRGMSTRNAGAEAEAMLRRVGLGSRMTHYPASVSGGESQRAAIARAVVSKPALVLADEPTGNLDQKNKSRYTELIRELQAEFALTMIVVTHDPELAAKASSRYIMDAGQLRSEGAKT